MKTQTLTMKLRKQGNVLILHPIRRFDIRQAVVIREVLAAYISAAPSPCVLFNLADVDFIDTPTLDLIVELTRLARSRGGDIKLVNVSQAVESILKFKSGSDLYTLYRTELDALASFRVKEGLNVQHYVSA